MAGASGHGRACREDGQRLLTCRPLGTLRARELASAYPSPELRTVTELGKPALETEFVDLYGLDRDQPKQEENTHLDRSHSLTDKCGNHFLTHLLSSQGRGERGWAPGLVRKMQHHL